MRITPIVVALTCVLASGYSTAEDAAKEAARDARGGSGFSLIDAGGLEYFINADVTFSTTESASGSASEASFTTAVAATTSLGGTTMTTLSDAFDGYNGLCISLDGGEGVCETNGGGKRGSATYEVYNFNGPAAVSPDGTGGTAVFQDQSMASGALTVRREVYVPGSDEFIRWLSFFTNTSGAPLSFNVVMANNLGSDGSTEIFTTSSGDTTVTAADRWIVSFQAFDGSGRSPDPRLCHVLQDGAGSSSLLSISFSDSDGFPFWAYTLTLQPGETRAIMNLASGQPGLADAQAACERLVQLPPEVVGDLSPTVRGQIANFGLGGPVIPEALVVPTLTPWALLILALAVLLVVATRLRSTG